MEWIKYALVYTADSIQKLFFEIESDGRFDSRFDSNAKKNDSQVPRPQPLPITLLINKYYAVNQLGHDMKSARMQQRTQSTLLDSTAAKERPGRDGMNTPCKLN